MKHVYTYEWTLPGALLPVRVSKIIFKGEQYFMDPKFPHIHVKLTGKDGNAFMLIGAVRTALSRNGIKREDIDEFTREAMSGDYDHVLQTCLNTVSVA